MTYPVYCPESPPIEKLSHISCVNAKRMTYMAMVVTERLNPIGQSI